MFDRKEWILNRLKAMELGELDDVSGLLMRGTDRWQMVAEAVRATLVEAYGHDDVDPDDLIGSLSGHADGLVPTYDRDVFWELTVVGSAWPLPANDVENGFDMPEGGTLVDIGKAALCRAYQDGLTSLVQALEEEADDVEAQDDDDEDVAGG